jgi:hypothetical protein
LDRWTIVIQMLLFFEPGNLGPGRVIMAARTSRPVSQSSEANPFLHQTSDIALFFCMLVAPGPPWLAKSNAT